MKRQGRDVPSATTHLREVCLASVHRERISWIWHGYIPRGKFVIVEGDPATGKSTVMLDLAARVTTGAVWPDGALGIEPAEVLLLSAEDGIADTVLPRFEAAGGDKRKVTIIDGVYQRIGESVTGDRSFQIKLDVERLRESILNHGARMVVIDVLNAFVGDGVDIYKDQHVRTALMPLVRVAEETMCTVVAIRHLVKGETPNPMHRGGGSMGIIGAARAAFLATTNPSDKEEQILACTKSNLAKLPTSLRYRIVGDDKCDCGRIEWLGSTDVSSWDLCEVGAQSVSAVAEAGDFLRHQLQDGALRATEVIERARPSGISERTLNRAKKQVGVKSTWNSNGRFFEWSMPRPSGST